MRHTHERTLIRPEFGLIPENSRRFSVLRNEKSYTRLVFTALFVEGNQGCGRDERRFTEQPDSSGHETVVGIRYMRAATTKTAGKATKATTSETTTSLRWNTRAGPALRWRQDCITHSGLPAATRQCWYTHRGDIYYGPGTRVHVRENLCELGEIFLRRVMLAWNATVHRRALTRRREPGRKNYMLWYMIYNILLYRVKFGLHPGACIIEFHPATLLVLS